MENNKKRTGLNIAIFSHSADMGGSERSMMFIAEGLIRRGHNLHFFVPYQGALIKSIEKLGADYTIWSYPWWIKDGQTITSFQETFWNSVIHLMPKIRKIKPDVIMTNTSVINIGSFLAKIYDIPHIWRISEFGQTDHSLNFMLDIKERAEYINNNSDKVLFISPRLRDYYGDKISGNKSEIILNAIEIDNNIGASKENFFSDKDNLKLLMLGTIQPGKGQMDGVKALKELVNKGHDKLELQIVGKVMDSEYFEKVRRFISENKLDQYVTFKEYTDNPIALLKSADLLLMCSKNEAFGRVTLEAALCGKPVVGTNSGGTPEIIEDGRSGFLYKSGDYKQLSKKIDIFYDVPDRLKKMSIEAKKYAKDKFDPGRYLNRVEKAIVETVNKKKDSKISDLPSDLIIFQQEKIKKLQNEVSMLNKNVIELDKYVAGLNDHINALNEDIKRLNEKPLNKTIRVVKRNIGRKGNG